MKHYISNSYTLKWEFKDFPNYKITKCKKVINVFTGKVIKRCYNGGSIGYWIGGSWCNINRVNERVIKIKEPRYPF